MKSSLKVFILLGALAGLVAGIVVDRVVLSRSGTGSTAATVEALDIEHARKHLDPTYVCPMHPQIVAGKPSTCPICGMDLVPVKPGGTGADEAGGRPVVSVSPSVMNSLGVRTAPVVRKTIVRRVEAPGFIQQIKKGRQSKFITPIDARVAEILFEKGVWYETGEPLMVLESEALLRAQERHLAILDASGGQSAGAATVASVTVDAPDAVTAGSETAEGDAGDTSPGVLSAEQRARLAAMGLNDTAIDEMEREMIKEMQASAGMDDSTGDAQGGVDSKDLPSALKAASEGEASSQPGSAPAQPAMGGSSAPQASGMTLDESRKALHGMGMRPEDIQRLEVEHVPSARLTLYSTHPGKIMNLKVGVGDAVEAGTFLFRLGGQVRAIVMANAFQRDAAWINTGQRVEIRMPHVSGEVWPGNVSQGSVSINPNSQNIGIKLAFSAPLDKVRSNQYVVGTIYGDARKDALSVPREAVIRTENEERVVKALGDGRFQPVLVTTGVEAGDEVEIVEGLQEGDEVVVMAQFLIDSESDLQESFRRLGGE